MKKLMIAAASAAMIGGAFADGVAQVYDFTATVKTTACSGKSAKDVCGDTVYYRQQITQKLYGKFWGCGCEVIACPDNYAIDKAEENGFVFWTTTKLGGAFEDADMQWSLLQRLGKKGENVEGFFGLTLIDDGDAVALLSGAGYGTAKIYCDDEDKNYIKSMSGNVVGYWDASADPIATGCYYCGGVEECTVFAFCSCVAEDNEFAAVFGTFTIKYNASQTKSVNGGKSITEVAFKKNPAVLAVLNATDDDDDDDDEDAKTKLEKSYAAAKATLDDLNKGANECSKGVELAQAVTDTATKYANAQAATTAAEDAIDDDANVQNYKGKVETYNTVMNNPVSSQNDKDSAAAAVTSAKNAIAGDKVDAAVTAVSNWIAAKAAEATALEAKNAASAAQAAWTTPLTGGYATELAAAKENLNQIKIACLVAGGDCE